MRTRILGLLFCLVLGTAGTMAYGATGQPYLGVRLDPAPLPPLLSKHLGLGPEQGIRVRNVNVGSPADKAGIERDDIVIAFQDEPVERLETFVAAVRQAGVGTTVSLEIVHLGQRKTLQVALAAFDGRAQWKYPPEPEIITSWHPGRFFSLGPDGDKWLEIPLDKMPQFDLDVRGLFDEQHVYEHKTDGEEFTIIIEGSPNDEDTRIIVRKGQTEYSTNVNDLDALPERYREPARDALENAKRSVRHEFRMRWPSLPSPPKLDLRQRLLKDLPLKGPDMEQWSEKKDQLLERLQEQVERLQQRMKELERRYLETDVDKPQQQSDTVEPSDHPAASGNEQAI